MSKTHALVCTMCHTPTPAVALMSYRFAGETRRRHYYVCLSHYSRFSRENLVSISYVTTDGRS